MPPKNKKHKLSQVVGLAAKKKIKMTSSQLTAGTIVPLIVNDLDSVLTLQRLRSDDKRLALLAHALLKKGTRLPMSGSIHRGRCYVMTHFVCPLISLSLEQVAGRSEQLFFFPDKRSIAAWANDFRDISNSPSGRIDTISSGRIDLAEWGDPIAWITLLEDHSYGNCLFPSQ